MSNSCSKCKYKKPCEQLNYLDVANTCSDLRKFAEQIRTDVIDEIEDTIINSFEDCNKMWTIVSVLHHIHEVLEQLKEQK